MDAIGVGESGAVWNCVDFFGRGDALVYVLPQRHGGYAPQQPPRKICISSVAFGDLLKVLQKMRGRKGRRG